jgi:hypothetical protein
MSSAPAKRENLLINIACNIVAPALILSKLSAEDRLGPVVALVVALAFPVVYGVTDFIRRRSFNFIAGIGFFSTLLTGGFALAELDGLWFAIKEAAVPAVIGLMVLFSMNAKRPLVRQFIYNEQVIDIPKVDAALAERGTRPGFESLMRRAAWLVAASFVVSAALNFILARWLLTGSAGTPEFNAQLAKMQWLSWPVIVLPSMAMMMFALWQLLGGLKKLTGLELDQLFHAQEKKP